MPWDKHRKLTKARALIVISALGLCLAPAYALFSNPGRALPLILFNPSASMPLGFYARHGAPFAKGAIVSLESAHLASTADQYTRPERRWRRFLKRVAAIQSDHVCAREGMLFINAKATAPILLVRSDGAPLHPWSGCRALEADEVLLLGESHDSYDGRYWGPVSAGRLEAHWRPLVTWRGREHPKQGQNP